MAIMPGASVQMTAGGPPRMVIGKPPLPWTCKRCRKQTGLRRISLEDASEEDVRKADKIILW